MKTMPFDVADFLNTDEKIAAYLNEVMAVGDPALTAAALGDVARVKGMSKVARETKKSREALYRSLSKKGNPELETVTRVLDSVGMRLHVIPIKRAAFKAVRSVTTKSGAKKRTIRKSTLLAAAHAKVGKGRGSPSSPTRRKAK